MKKFIISCLVFVALLGVIIVHSVTMVRLGSNIKNLSKETKELANSEKWDEVLVCIDEIENEWEKKSFWTALTIKTDEIEKIEISLNQSKKYAELEEKGMFLGEFIMFSKLVEHIPHQEGFHIEEIL